MASSDFFDGEDSVRKNSKLAILTILIFLVFIIYAFTLFFCRLFRDSSTETDPSRTPLL